MARRLVTVWLCLFLVLTGSLASASDALILIKGENAGPNVPAAIESHPNWVLWPVPYPSGSENGLLSLFTGQDWRGDSNFLQFVSAGKAQWKGKGYEGLLADGYLQRKALFLRGHQTPLIADGWGNSSPEALLLSSSLGQANVSAKKWERISAQDAILVFQAHSWDDVAFVSRRSGGRTLVVEYPPQGGTRWSRFWMFGSRWPIGIPTSPDLNLGGVVHARDLVRTIIQPSSLRWISGKIAPEPWLARINSISPVVRGVVLGAIFFALGFGSFLVRTERSSPAYRSFVLLLLGLPAIDFAAGLIAGLVGLNAWIAIVPALGCVVLAALTLINTVLKSSPDQSETSFLGISGLGLVVCLMANPFLSDYSPILSWGHEPISFEVLGLMGAYAVGVLTPLRSWYLRIFVVGLIIGVTLLRFGVSAPFPLLMIGPLALLASLPFTWFTALGVIAISPFAWSNVTHLCWTPFGLMMAESDASGLDFSEYLFRWISVPFFGFLFLVITLSVSTLGFGQHVLLRAHRKSALTPPLSKLALYLALASLAIPGMFSAALVVILGWVLVTCYVATA